MPFASARPSLALASRIRIVVHSRTAFLSASSLRPSQSLSTTSAAAAASKMDAAEKKSSTSTTSSTSTPPKEKQEQGPKKSTRGQKEPESVEEIGGPKGPEPTRYNDWEKNGRCSDF